MRPALLLLALAVPGPALSDPAPESPPPTSTDMQRSMLRHDELAEKSRAAIVAGDLDAFRLGFEIAAVQPLPGSHAEQASTFVARARVASEVNDLRAAAMALGSAGAACAACHQQTPRERFPASGFEEGDRDVIDRMQRHWWATEAMWRGLVGPDDGAWKVGTMTLADTSLTAIPGFPQSEQARALATALQSSAQAAQKAQDPESRGKALGEVMVQCAACHKALGAGPMSTGP